MVVKEGWIMDGEGQRGGVADACEKNCPHGEGGFGWCEVWNDVLVLNLINCVGF